MHGKNAEFRVRSDVMDLKVCPNCAFAAGALGLAVEPLAKVHGLRTAVQKQLMDLEFLSETRRQKGSSIAYRVKKLRAQSI